MRLTDHRHNLHSQNGEDGVLAKLFEVVGVTTGYFAECGAWDGRHLSNTFALAEQGWRGCLIEGDPKRFERMSSVVGPGSVKVCRFVTPEGPDSLDSILAEVGAPARFELLSIDIDSNDLAIWRSLQRFRPRCVVIEYNPTIPFDCRFENPPGRQWGNSALSIATFAETAGYTLVCVTESNLLFYDSRSEGAALVEEVALSEDERGPRFFWGYDGTLLRLDPGKDGTDDCAPELFDVPWTKFRAFQPIPKPLRGYGDQRSVKGVARRVLSLAIAACLRPASSLRAGKMPSR